MRRACGALVLVRRGAKGLADADLGTFADANQHTAVCLVPAVRTFFPEGSNPTHSINE